MEEKRPWGNYVVLPSLVLSSGDNCKVKKITVDPGQRFSLQKHFLRSEWWFVLQGTALVTLNETQFEFSQGEQLTIPIEAVHRVENKTKEPFVFLEIQFGETLSEDDILRLEDDYGREN